LWTGVHFASQSYSTGFARSSARLVRHIRKGVLRLLGRRNISLGRDGDDFEDPLVEENPALASVSAASVYGLTAIGSRAGCRLRRLGEEPEAVAEKPKRKRHARYRGFDLHAGAPVKAEERDRLERLLRYLLRPAVAESRLRLLADGTVLLKTKSKWDDTPSPSAAECKRHDAPRSRPAGAARKARGDHPPAADQPGHLPRCSGA